MTGRSFLTPRLRRPLFYRVSMKLSAPEHVVAKSPCWYFASQLRKVKSSGEMVYCGQEIPAAGEELWHLLHYDSHSGTHDTYREYPDLITAGTVTHAHVAPCPGPLSPDHEGGGGRSQQVPQTSSSATARSDSCCPTPASITCTSQALPPRGYHLLLSAGLLCP